MTAYQPSPSNANPSDQPTLSQNQLQQLERLAKQLYSSENAIERQNATQVLSSFTSRIEAVTDCRLILDNSNEPYALLLAAQSLANLILNFWTSFTHQQTIDLRLYLLNYLYTHVDIPQYVQQHLVTSVVRIAKLGWRGEAAASRKASMTGIEDLQPVEIKLKQSANAHNRTVDDIKKFFSSPNEVHRLIGLNLLIALCEVMQNQLTNSSGVHLETYQEHRKTARAIRDDELHDILKLSLSTLSTLLEMSSRGQHVLSQTQYNLMNRSLQLLIDCLSYDFLGTVTDESTDEAASWQIHVPVAWRETLAASQTLELIWSLLFNESKGMRENELSSQAMKRVEMEMNVLILFASVRRTLFIDDIQRIAYVNRICAGVTLLFTQYAPLLACAEANVFHFSWMLLARLKHNYSFLDICSIDNFADFITMLGKVCISNGLQRWNLNNNTIHYMCAFWSRVVHELPTLQPEKTSDEDIESQLIDDEGSEDEFEFSGDYSPPNGAVEARLRQAKAQQALINKHSATIQVIDEQLISELLFAYVNGRLDAINHYIENGDLEELHDVVFGEVSLADQLKFVPQLARHQLNRTRDWLKNKLDICVNLFNASVKSFQENRATDKDRQQLTQVEAQMALLLYILGAILGGSVMSQAHILDSFMISLLVSGAVPKPTSAEEEVDAEMVSWFFQLLPLIEFRISSPIFQKQIQNNRQLALAMLYWMNAFRSRYLTSGRIYSRPSGDDLNNPLIECLTKFVGPTSMLQILNVIVKDILFNLQYWSTDKQVLTSSLELFEQLSTSYSTIGILTQLEPVKALIKSHDSLELFPFMSQPKMSRLQTTYYTILGRLVYRQVNPTTGAAVNTNDFDTKGSDQSISFSFPVFMSPFTQVFQQLSAHTLASVQLQKSQSETVAAQTICICRKLQGLLDAVTGPSLYLLFFRWIYPTYTPMLLRLLEQFSNENVYACQAILDLFSELAHNKNSRINFGEASAESILLFRELSRAIQIYGSRVASTSISGDTSNSQYKSRIKAITVCLRVLLRVFSGLYLNVGILILYNDPAYSNALKQMFELMMMCKITDILHDSELSQVYFPLIETLLRYHFNYIITESLDHRKFMTILQTIQAGLQSFDMTVAISCCESIHQIFTHIKTINDTYKDVTIRQQQQSPTIQLNASADETTVKLYKSLSRHFHKSDVLITDLVDSLFTLYVFGSKTHHYTLQKTITSVLIVLHFTDKSKTDAIQSLSMDSVKLYQEKLMALQPNEEMQKRLQTDFEILLNPSHQPLSTSPNVLRESSIDDIHSDSIYSNTDPWSRERVSQRLVVFRQSLIRYCVRPMT